MIRWLSTLWCKAFHRGHWTDATDDDWYWCGCLQCERVWLIYCPHYRDKSFVARNALADLLQKESKE